MRILLIRHARAVDGSVFSVTGGAGAPWPLIAFKKGGAALIDFADSNVRAGGGVWRWVLTPQQLRNLK